MVLVSGDDGCVVEVFVVELLEFFVEYDIIIVFVAVVEVYSFVFFEECFDHASDGCYA